MNCFHLWGYTFYTGSTSSQPPSKQSQQQPQQQPSATTRPKSVISSSQNQGTRQSQRILARHQQQQQSSAADQRSLSVSPAAPWMVSYYSVSLSDLSIPNSSLFLFSSNSHPLSLFLLSLSSLSLILAWWRSEIWSKIRGYVFTCCKMQSNTSIMMQKCANIPLISFRN